MFIRRQAWGCNHHDGMAASSLGIFVLFFLFFFVKQKTAYENSECDWSADVCSSDLLKMHELHASQCRFVSANDVSWKHTAPIS